MLVQPGLRYMYQVCIFRVNNKLCTEVPLMTKSGEKNNFVFSSVMRFMLKLLRFQPILWATHRETISKNSIAIIKDFLLNALNYFINANKTYLCLYVSILWSDLESSRMCLWNKITIPPFGACSNVNHS